MEDVLLIQKIRGLFPDALNGIGGKGELEDGSHTATAFRELEEESGYKADDFSSFNHLSQLHFNETDITLHIYYGILKSNDKEFKQKTDEVLAWYKVSEVLSMSADKLAGNGDVAKHIKAARVHQNL